MSQRVAIPMDNAAVKIIDFSGASVGKVEADRQSTPMMAATWATDESTLFTSSFGVSPCMVGWRFAATGTNRTGDA